MVTLPHRLLTHPNVSILYRDADVCMLEKRLPTSQYERPGYASMHVLSIVQAGEQQLVTERGVRMSVRPGQAVLLRRGLYTVTDLISTDGRGFRASLLYFTGKELKGKAATGPAIDYQRLPWDTARPMPATRKGAIELLRTIPEVNRILTAPHRRDPLVFLDEHYDKPLTLADLAYLTGMSTSTFQREFKRRTGESPRNWIIRRRMGAARELLRAGNTSVAAVAANVGYRNTSHFITTYRRAYGHTPLTEYRHFGPTGSRSL